MVKSADRPGMTGFSTLPLSFPRNRSVRYKLTALFFTIIGLLALAFAWVAYAQMTEALHVNGTERIRAAAQQVADLLAQSAAARTAEARRLANDPDVRAALHSAPPSAPAAVQDFLSRNPSATVWAYETAAGARRLGVGTEGLAEDRPQIEFKPGVSELTIAGERVWYHTTVPIAGAETIPSHGFLSVQRSIRPSQANELIGRLIGPGAVLKFGNVSGDVWTDMSGRASAPPLDELEVGSRYANEAGEKWVGIAVPVAETPWALWVAVPEYSILAPAHVLLRTLLPIASLLMGFGVLAVYVLSGRITRPLNTLASAAEGIARGDYTRRVTVESADEVGRLATIFNAMADRVAQSRDTLEARVVERTRQLEVANTALSESETKLRKTTAFLDSIVENLPAVLFVKDREGRYVRLNRACEEVLGKRAHDLLGRTDAELFPPEMAARFVRSDLELLQGGASVSLVDEMIPTTSGGVRVLQTTKIPVLDPGGQPEYLLGIAVDLTDRRKAEEAARTSRSEAERASRAKSEFLSRMSHDLRTPLNAMLGFAQLLSSDPDLSGDHADSVRHILKGGSHLLKLVNEVLDIARIESGGLSLSLEPVRVAEVVDEVTQLMRPLAERRNITMSIDALDVHVLADNQRLKQVLLNLVGNAIKYNRENGAVRVTVRPEFSRVRIEVHDTGSGIAEEKRGLLFRPFERLGAEQGEIEGTGLGLAVAKGLIEAMNGRIGLDAPPEGSIFWITLPIAQATERQEAQEVDAWTHNGFVRAGTVLYIEDNPSNLRLIERLLVRRPGVRLAVARNGQDGFQLAFEQNPDLILLDLHLPDISGEEVLHRLTSDHRTSAIPVVVVSADATTVQRKRLLRAGAKDYLTKPIVLASFLAMIDRHMLTRGQQPQPTVR
jgi:PAS domain S-box-containing protein